MKKKWNIQNYVQDLPQSVYRADKSKFKIKIPGTHGTLKTMTLARHMHYICLTADMSMVTLTTL